MRVLVPAMPYNGSAAQADPQDLLLPSRIEHVIDQCTDTTSSRLEFHYNYLVYHFDVEPTPIVARAYLDEPETVSVLNWRDLDPSSHLVRAAILYLARRYPHLQGLAAEGYEPLETLSAGWIALRAEPGAKP